MCTFRRIRLIYYNVSFESPEYVNLGLKDICRNIIRLCVFIEVDIFMNAIEE